MLPGLIVTPFPRPEPPCLEEATASAPVASEPLSGVLSRPDKKEKRKVCFDSESDAPPTGAHRHSIEIAKNESIAFHAGNLRKERAQLLKKARGSGGQWQVETAAEKTANAWQELQAKLGALYESVGEFQDEFVQFGRKRETMEKDLQADNRVLQNKLSKRRGSNDSQLTAGTSVGLERYGNSQRGLTSQRSTVISRLSEEAELPRGLIMPAVSEELVSPHHSEDGMSGVRSWSPQDSSSDDPEPSDEHDDDTSQESSDDEEFRLLDCWKEQKSGPGHVSKALQQKAHGNGAIRGSALRHLTYSFGDEQALRFPQRDKQPFCRCRHAPTPLSPTSLTRAAWDSTSLLFVAVDLVLIPMQFFNVEDMTGVVVITWIARLFWTFDLPLNFVTGFMKSDGAHELSYEKIALNYVTTWFALDFFVVLADWLMVDMAKAVRFGKVARGTRVLRLLRLLKLLRVIKAVKMLRLNSYRVHSEKLAILIEVFAITMSIIMLAHIMACLWYGIGSGNIVQLKDGAQSWTGELPASMMLGERYAVSLHWALSQFTGGMDEVRCLNVVERIYAICVFVIAYVVAAVFVSGLTSSMTRLHIITSHQAKQFSHLKRYLAQNGISDALSLRINRNATHAFWEQQSFTPESHVELLGLISVPLRIDLHFELYDPVLHVHPFFAEYSRRCPQVMRKICHGATTMALASRGDTIFDAGEIPAPPQMYIVCAGELQYVSLSGRCVEVRAVQCMAEATLWTPWMHMGVLTATNECRLVKLNSATFQQIVLQFSHEEYDPRKYAAEFVDQLNSYMGEITDLPWPKSGAVDAQGTRPRLTKRMSFHVPAQ